MDDREFPVNIGIACVRWIPKHCLRDIDIIQELSQLINPLNHCLIFKYNLFLNADFFDIDILDIVIQMSKSGLKIKRSGLFFFRSEKSFFFLFTFKAFLPPNLPLLCSIFQTTLSVWPWDFCRARQSWRRETIKPRREDRTVRSGDTD